MNFARLSSRPRLMVDQVVLCSVKGPCYGGGADLKRDWPWCERRRPLKASSHPCVMSLEGCRGRWVACRWLNLVQSKHLGIHHDRVTPFRCCRLLGAVLIEGSDPCSLRDKGNLA
jgi:hypothetical protein